MVVVAFSARPIQPQSFVAPPLTSTVRRARYRDGSAAARYGRKRSSVRRTQLASVPGASLKDFVDVSHIVAASSGFLLAAGTALALRRQDQIQSAVQNEQTAVLESKIGKLEDALAETKEQWEQDRRRVEVLEKARAAAVRDVTAALGQKRDAEFALSDAQEEIQRLQINQRPTGASEQSSDTEALMSQLPNELKEQLGAEGEKALKQWLASVIQGIETGSVESKAELEHLQTELREQRKRAVEAESEIRTVKDYAKAELQSMTSVLIQGRDEAQGLKEEISALKGEASQLRLAVAEAEAVIEDLQGQLQTAKTTQTETSPSSFPDKYVHKMRAEAAYMVESIEEKAHARVHEVLQKSQFAQKRALKELIEATKAKQREEQLRDKLSEAQNRIKEQSVQLKYLTELIQILSSKEMQENAEEQTINQQFPSQE